jgi:IS30 family transposase
MIQKGNQKHLTFEQRVEIEKGLTENKSFSQIAKTIDKDPSTVSKEVRLHAHTKERPDVGYTNPPCIHRKTCKIVCRCDEQCGTHCKICKKPSMRCIDVCPGYETAECEKLKKPPYVCNGCGKKTNCLMPRMFYSSKYAQDEYHSVLIDCRVGINQNMKEHPDTNVVEMDCVEGKKGESRALLTLTFRNCNLMLIFLLEHHNQERVLKVFVWLETVLGKSAFRKLFPVILTDGGSEFSAREEMEKFSDGSKSTTIFYCDPYSFWQKGACEKNHEYIRYIIPKGNSFADLDDDKVTLMMNHINNEKRDSLNGHSPYELSLLLLDKKLHKSLELKEIKPDDVMTCPTLLK